MCKKGCGVQIMRESVSMGVVVVRKEEREEEEEGECQHEAGEEVMYQLQK